MCGLIFCQDGDRWEEIVAANLARAGRNKGAFTATPVLSVQGWGSVTTGPTVEIGAGYRPELPVIAHLQAPTSEASRPHPAVAGEVRVWHNGIIKSSGIGLLGWEMYSSEAWDTMLIAQSMEAGIGSDAFQLLGNIEGSLAVIAIDNTAGQNTIYAFRNAIAPLFTDGRNLSSVAVGDVSRSIDPGRLYSLADGMWQKTRFTFPCTHNPFGLPT